MSLGLLNPQPAHNVQQQLNTSSSLPQHSTPIPSSHATTSPPDSAMSNVTSQGDEEPSTKDSFDPSSLRPSLPLSTQPDSARQSLPFPSHVPIPSHPLTAALSHHPSPASHPSALAHPNPGPSPVHYPVQVESRPRDNIPTYDLFSEINVAPIVPGVQTTDSHPSVAASHAPHPSQQNTQPLHQLASAAQQPSAHALQHLSSPMAPTGHSAVQAAAAAAAAVTAPPPPPPAPTQGQGQPSHAPYDRKGSEAAPYTSIPLAASSSGINKRNSRADVHEHSSSQSLQSPSQRVHGTQSSIERRKAHRAYTQKSRNKVNSRFEALLDALPTPPPRLNPRSKAEILEYATETVIRLVSQNNKLELSLALSSTPHLEAWISDQTQNARTVREVCQPIMRLFTIGLEWKGSEAWAVDSRAPMATAALGQAWTFVPPSGRRPTRDDEGRASQLGAFLESGRGAYFSTTGNEAVAMVYRTGKPAWVSCEYKTHMGFEEGEFATERMRLAMTYGISDVLFVPLILYNHVQIVVNFYNMRSRTPAGNPALQPQTDPKSAIKVATEAIAIIARRFCSLPGVREFAEK